MSTDTPRTDAAKLPDGEYRGPLVWADFARTLERELAASRAEVEELTKERNVWADSWRKDIPYLRGELDTLRTALAKAELERDEARKERDMDIQS